MGGKKKKSAAAQAAAPVAPAATGTGVAEEKKQPASNKPNKPAKENKSKGDNPWQQSTLEEVHVSIFSP